MLVKDFSNIEFDPDILEIAIEDANISQTELSEIIGYPHKNVVNKIVRGKRAATANDLLRFSMALEKDPKDFAKIVWFLLKIILF